MSESPAKEEREESEHRKRIREIIREDRDILDALQ